MHCVRLVQEGDTSYNEGWWWM